MSRLCWIWSTASCSVWSRWVCISSRIVSSGQYLGLAADRKSAICCPLAYQAVFAASTPAVSPAFAASSRVTAPEMCACSRVFEDEGHSGATLQRPALERLRDLVAGIGVEVVICYSPDRLARKFAYQALLIEEFTRAGTRVEFVKGPRGDSPEDQLLVQFQGMFAEYEKAQIAERYRRGKAHRARVGSVNVLSGAPFGYRYVRKSPLAPAAYQIVEHEAVLVREIFRRYT